ncbi:hypothetical protein CC78DRAFT_544598 [Lojkania enalia]|uniref:Uncharacterized protein n=1 Tax=Lojkania enalia TaxID=147567 RepID=A0A9P4MZM5_9PLEO|nr:hypothetical protein CC78DRAFT_544598 [Didymosphaeria enalia]
MQLTVPSLALALAALTGASSIEYGHWSISASVADGYKELTASYLNHQADINATVHCTNSDCDDASFSYELSSDDISLTQTVQIANKPTKVSGSGPITLTCDSGSGKSCTGSTKVQAEKES